MLLVTGGAGFIGSNVVAALNDAGRADVAVCDILERHGIRVVLYPGDRFQLRMTEAITVPRDAKGKVDMQGTMQVITDVVESWVREHPEQWLWLHRRWR